MDGYKVNEFFKQLLTKLCPTLGMDVTLFYVSQGWYTPASFSCGEIGAKQNKKLMIKTLVCIVEMHYKVTSIIKMDDNLSLISQTYHW